MSLLADIEGANLKVLNPSGSCATCIRQRRGFVPANLQGNKTIFVGDLPGKDDVREGVPFSGASGGRLKASINEAGMDHCAFTYVSHCRPADDTSVDPRAIECCLSQYVLEEVRGYEIVVLVGTAALTAFFPGARGKNFRGNVARHPDFPGQKFYAIYDPAYLFRRPDLEGTWKQQFERLGRLHHGEPDPDFQIFNQGGEEFTSRLRATLSMPFISLDIETNMLASWKPDSTIRSVALTANGVEVFFVHEDQPHFLGVIGRIREYLLDENKAVVGHNIGFDLDWLEQELGFHCKLQAIHDTGPIFYEAKQYKMPSLKQLVSHELDGYRYLVHNPATMQDVDLLGRYNAEDVVYPLQLFREGMKLLKPKGRDLVTRVSGPSSYVLRKITSNGMAFDQEKWAELRKEYANKKEEARAAWQAADPDFIPHEHESGKGLVRYLFQVKGLTTDRTTDSGAPATDASTVKAWIREGHTFLEPLLELRRMDKIIGTYLEAYADHIDPNTGRIHPDFTNSYTDSGRTSSRNPNAQNIPRNKQIRSLFNVPYGHVLMEADFSQIEFRIMVSLAQDENGIAAYNRGEDAHTMTARSFSGGGEPTKEQRNHAKAINFALLFGGDWYNVQRTAREWYGLDFSERESRKFTQAFWETYPRLPNYHEKCERKLVINRGWFESVTGHTFHYHNWDHPDKGKRDHAIRSALNAEAQGPAAQICLLVMRHAQRLFRERELGTRIMNTVHDSMILDVPSPELVGPTAAAIEEARAIAYEWVKPWLVVPLIMDYEVGPSWGEKDDWKPGQTVSPAG